VCCLVMPIFIGSSCKVDDDGNPDYDLKPMLGAYAVTVVKYVALFFLHGGAITICISVFSMTPENAVAGGRIIQGGRSLVVGLVMTLVVVFFALLLSSAKVIGLAVKFAIESCDQLLLGVDLTLKHAALSVCKGYVNVSDLIVHQPVEEIVYERDASGTLVGRKTGKINSWDKNYIFKVKKVLVKIDMWRVIKSRGKEFEITDLNFSGISVNIEKPTMSTKQANSNMDYITNHLESYFGTPVSPGDHDAAEGPASTNAASASDSPPQLDAAPEAAAQSKTGDDPGPRVILHKLIVGDVGCVVRVGDVPVVGTLTFTPKIGIIKFDDVQREACNGRDDLVPGELVACIITTVAARILKVVLKEIPMRLVANTGAKVRQSVGKCLGGSCLKPA